MNKKILIITADNLGLHNSQIEYPDLEVLKFPVIVNGREYRESDECTSAWLIDKFVKEKVVAKSSTLVKGELIDIIEKNKDKYDFIIHIIMSSVMSNATYLIAEDVKKMYSDIIPIVNIDTRQVTAGIGIILLKIIDLIKETDDIDEIKKRSDPIIKNTSLILALPDLNYLYKGGRIGKAKALMGSVLRIIPVLGLFGNDPEGKIVPVGKGRTFSQVNSIITDLMLTRMKETGSENINTAVISYFEDCKDSADDLINKINSNFTSIKIIRSFPRFVEAIYYGPKGYSVSFIPD